MPKKIITEETLKLAVCELDKWSGKLTWELYADKLAQILGVTRISRHTLLSYPMLVQAFNQRKAQLKARRLACLGKENDSDITLEYAKEQIHLLEDKVERLEKLNARLQERFVRWQHNAYMMPGVDMDRLDFDKPLPKVDRRQS